MEREQHTIDKNYMVVPVDRNAVERKGQLTCSPRITGKGIKKIYKILRAEKKAKEDRYLEYGVVKRRGKKYYDKDGYLVLMPRH